MATTTTNFGFDIPQSTDLVKDGADAIAELGQDIDTRFGNVATYPNQIVNVVSGVSRPIAYAMQAGTLSMPATSATVTFVASRFTQAPLVVANTQTATLGRGVTISAVSTASFTILGYVTTSAAATTTVFNYIAVQMTSASASG